MILGSINRGNRSIANNESDVNVFVGVRLLLSKENILNEITVIIIGMLFRRKLLYCKKKMKYIRSFILYIGICLYVMIGKRGYNIYNRIFKLKFSIYMI